MSDTEGPFDARELTELRKLYGAKFNAICAALGHVSEAKRLLEEGDTVAVGDHLEDAERILADA